MKVGGVNYQPFGDLGRDIERFFNEICGIKSISSSHQFLLKMGIESAIIKDGKFYCVL